MELSDVVLVHIDRTRGCMDAHDGPWIPVVPVPNVKNDLGPRASVPARVALDPARHIVRKIRDGQIPVQALRALDPAGQRLPRCKLCHCTAVIRARNFPGDFPREFRRARDLTIHHRADMGHILAQLSRVKRPDQSRIVEIMREGLTRLTPIFLPREIRRQVRPDRLGLAPQGHRPRR
ncbi:hypothetical protein EBZ80_19615 [bacterium]|nr:hypothetical protein [bacterium]